MKKTNVILIDGGQPHMVSLKFILEKNGYEVAVKTLSGLKEDGGEEKEWRIIIIDAQATNLDLLRDEKERAKMLRKSDKILLLTEYDCEDLHSVFKNIDKVMILKKPFQEKEFIRLLEKLDILDMIVEIKMKKLEESMEKLDERMKRMDEYLNEKNERISGLENKINKKIKVIMSKFDIEDDNKNEKI